MTRVITTIHLSDIQKEVLCKVQASPNPQIAWETIADTESKVDDNFSAAKDILGKLGLLNVGEGTLEVTEKGIQVMVDENLVDDMGELTDVGQQLADKNREEQPDEPDREGQEQMPPGGDDMQGLDMMGGLEGGGAGGEMGGGMDMPPMESLSLFRSINESAKIRDEIERLNQK